MEDIHEKAQYRTRFADIDAPAAGIDIGSRFHVVAVPTALAEEPVQTFQTFTADLERMAAWLVELGIKLLSNLVYGVGQAAFLSDSSRTRAPSLNFTLFTTSFSSANPLSRFHFFCATSSSL